MEGDRHGIARVGEVTADTEASNVHGTLRTDDNCDSTNVLIRGGRVRGKGGGERSDRAEGRE